MPRLFIADGETNGPCSGSIHLRFKSGESIVFDGDDRSIVFIDGNESFAPFRGFFASTQPTDGINTKTDVFN